MSDETTLLPCPICGRKATINSWWSSDEECGVAGVGCSRESYTNGYECARIHIMRVDEKTARKDAIRIWNTRATHGKLTAELVERIVDRNCEWYEGGDVDAQAIVDELNAVLGSEINGDTSDGYHTFNELYHHRAVLFSVIVRDHRELAWKARKHHDGTMYDGMFIVGIETPKGQATYHYDLDPYWEMFDCEEREYAPEWDGHTPDDAIARIAELGSDTKLCYAADENYKRCKYSVNRGWCDDAPFLVWDDTGHLFITMGGLKTWDVTDDVKKWFAELGSGTCELTEIITDCETASEWMLDRFFVFDSVYRCSCGKTFGHIAKERPKHCPHCGGNAKVVE